MAKPPLRLQTTTLWSYPSQHFDEQHEGQHQGYRGATPDYILWNLLSRYTRPKDLVVDPMCGSGTTIVVAREMARRALGYDLQPAHPDVFRADARKLPLESAKADFCFVDPPYSDHIRYSGQKECLGELSALDPSYYAGLDQVFSEMIRVLRPERYLAVYVHDSFEKGKPFMPIGYRIFELLSRRLLVPVDAIAIMRNNRTLLRNHFHTAAVEHNYYLRGFGHLLVFYKPSERAPLPIDRRDPQERQQQLAAFEVAQRQPEARAHPERHEGTHPKRHAGAHPERHEGAHPERHEGAHLERHEGAHLERHEGTHPKRYEGARAKGRREV
jgi:SAM-dependent methyltransferase